MIHLDHYATHRVWSCRGFAFDLRDHAFKLRPIAMSSDLILQLKACAVKLQEAAEKLQARVKQQKNKNKHYAAIISEARFKGKEWGSEGVGVGIGKGWKG